MSAYDSRPVAIFDSGLGGLSVLACALELAPQENYLYLADLANAPYGERPLEQIRALVRQDFDFLLSHHVKAVVVACNTATAASVALLRQAHPDLPIIGMEPAVKTAAVRCPNGETAVLATPATLSLGMFKRLQERFSPIVGVRSVPCAGLSNMIDHDASDESLQDYLYARLDPNDERVTSIVLGCTHYVLIAPLIQKLYPGRSVLSGTEGTVRHMADVLNKSGLCAPSAQTGGHVTYLCTSDICGIEEKMRAVTARARAARVWENAFPERI